MRRMYEGSTDYREGVDKEVARRKVEPIDYDETEADYEWLDPEKSFFMCPDNSVTIVTE